jgi:hypothetical protein
MRNIALMVITALFSGCVTERSPPLQKQEFNQTVQRQLPPPDRAPPPGDGEQKKGGVQDLSNLTDLSESCIMHTKDNPECKDCCDCLPGDANTLKSCRDACAVHDFGQNVDFIPVTTVSVLGPGGNYSVCSGSGSETACKECCDGSSAISCGDRRFCRDVCNAMGSGVQPPANPKGP